MSLNTRRWAFAAILTAAALLVGCSSSDGSTSGSDEGSWTRIDPARLDERLRTEEVFLVNVHVPDEGQIPGTDATIAYDEIASRVSELPSDTSTLVIYCRSGNMSTQASQSLVDAGVTGFSELEGGYQAWQAAGLPFQAPVG